jgi:CheY-like chemotaxis protein
MPKTLRILVADDNPLNLRAAARILREMGHSGVLVTDGEKAIKALAGQSFDLVLLDVTMPVMNGEEVLAAIRQSTDLNTRRLPVLMVTGHDLPSDLQRFLQAGANGHLAKPLDSTQLQREIQRVTQT